ncbi:hypothetical protein BLOT_002580 [Blomia tropicalis]|nr:hypothetical protein BLOT_002580 [Blomia tropicalis]
MELESFMDNSGNLSEKKSQSQPLSSSFTFVIYCGSQSKQCLIAYLRVHILFQHQMVVNFSPYNNKVRQFSFLK